MLRTENGRVQIGINGFRVSICNHDAQLVADSHDVMVWREIDGEEVIPLEQDNHELLNLTTEDVLTVVNTVWAHQGEDLDGLAKQINTAIGR